MRESSLEHRNPSEHRELLDRFVRDEEVMFGSVGMVRADDSRRLAIYRLTTRLALEVANGMSE